MITSQLLSLNFSNIPTSRLILSTCDNDEEIGNEHDHDHAMANVDESKLAQLEGCGREGMER